MKDAAKGGMMARSVSWWVRRRWAAVASRRMATSERKTAAAMVRQATAFLRWLEAAGSGAVVRVKADASVASICQYPMPRPRGERGKEEGEDSLNAKAYMLGSVLDR